MVSKIKTALYALLIASTIYPIDATSTTNSTQPQSVQEQVSPIASLLLAVVIGFIIALVLSLLIPIFINFIELLGLTVLSSWLLINSRILVIGVSSLAVVGTGVYRYRRYHYQQYYYI